MKQKLSAFYVKTKKNITSLFRFPNLFATTSRWIAMPILGFAAISSMYNYLNKPVNEFFGMFIATIGITLALAALCGQIASVVNREDDTYWVFAYSAEKFLHASLLLIQTLAVVFAKESLFAMGWISKSDVFTRTIQVIVIYTSACAYWCWIAGFQHLNRELWSRWKGRIDKTYQRLMDRF